MNALFVFLGLLLINFHLPESYASSFSEEADKLVKRVWRLEAKAFTGQLIKVNSPVLHLYIKSEGCEDPGIIGCGQAVIRVNGKDHAKKRRGYNIVVVNSQTGTVQSSSSFDTCVDTQAANRMKNFLRNLPKRRLVLIAIHDEGARLMNTAAYNELIKLGASNILKKHYRSSYAQIGWTGPGQVNFATQVQKLRRQGPSIIAKVLPLPL